MNFFTIFNTYFVSFPLDVTERAKEHPDETQTETAVAFGCYNQAVDKALGRPEVAHKKRVVTKSGTRK